jgi:hypothetical protein
MYIYVYKKYFVKMRISQNICIITNFNEVKNRQWVLKKILIKGSQTTTSW